MEIYFLLIIAGGWVAGRSLFGRRYDLGAFLKDLSIACLFILAAFALVYITRI